MKYHGVQQQVQGTYVCVWSENKQLCQMVTIGEDYIGGFCTIQCC